MKRLSQILFVAILISLFATAEAFGSEGYIEAEGIIYYEKGMSPNQMRRMSILDAYRYLAEQVDTINVTSETTVKNLRDMDDTINTKVEAALHGAKVVAVNRASDGSFHAIVRMPIYGGAQSLAGAVLQEDIRIEEFAQPRFTSIRTEITYTGLIIDCRGLSLSTAIAPAIKSVGGLEIYAYKNVGYQNATGKGMVEYSSNLNSPRAGTSPLCVKAVSIGGGCDVIVSDEDADKILAANISSNILVNCAVVLVR